MRSTDDRVIRPSAYIMLITVLLRNISFAVFIFRHFTSLVIRVKCLMKANVTDFCGCFQIIFSDECTEAEGNSWHTKHFVCCDCESPLGGQRYVMTDGRPFCCVCYERLYAAVCATCRNTIHITDGHMMHGSRRWHAADSCFCCDSCACSLLGCPFIAVPGKDAIFCGDCGVTNKAINSTSYVGGRSGNCFSPNSPMMKVSEPSVTAFYGRFEGADGKNQSFEKNWSDESPLKDAAKFVSPRSSPLQCKPAAAKLRNHATCANTFSRCDDGLLSQFKVSTGSHVDGFLASEPTSEKSLLRISPTSNAGQKSSAQTADCSDTKDDILQPPVLVASRTDFLEDADEINTALEELIVEPMWSRSEPDGPLAAAPGVVGGHDTIGQKSRKSKNLNVRFDPSTKDASSPVGRNVCCDRWHPHRSLDDSDLPYSSYGSRRHAAGPDGSASVRVRRRGFGHGRHRRQNDVVSDADVRRSASMHQGGGRWVDVDDYDHCSTCSSSSSDSDFDYSEVEFRSRPATVQSHTLPQRRHNTGPAVINQQVQHSKKHKKKNCIMS